MEGDRRPWPRVAIVCTSLVVAAFSGASSAESIAAAPTLERRPVPVFMYHVIDDPPRSAPYPDLYVSRKEFEAQVRPLVEGGYQAVTLGRVLDAWAGHGTLPRRPVVLSFDDGYRSHVTAALPILGRHRWPGVLNLGLSNLAPSWGIPRRGVERLIASGWEIAAHSLTHADVSALSGAALVREVSGSRKAISRLFGVVPRSFCYPAGRYDEEAIAAVRAAGYEAATTTAHGLADRGEPFTLARVRVSRGDGAAGLARKLRSLGLPLDRRRVNSTAGRSVLDEQVYDASI